MNSKFATSRAWPFVQARRVLERLEGQKREVVFETGYGASGLPHLGTFAEVLRTSMIINAFKKISDAPTKLICFSDDMDGLRKVPGNIPNKKLIEAHIGRALCQIPDPFEEEESFSAQTHKRLKRFLDKFDFEYELLSSSDCYKSGRFDQYLLKVLENYDAIMAIMLPSLREQRRSSYSPFLPICPETGKVLQVATVERNVQNGTIKYIDPSSGQVRETKVTGGNCKLQWKPDFAMRWAALKVDFEMYGKDVGTNEDIYIRICQALGAKPPVLFTYELFLDENAQRLSKSKGNSIEIEKWLEYAPVESLQLFIYKNPERAKRIHLGIIPRCVDEYLSLNATYHTQTEEEQLENPVYHIHNGKVPQLNTFGLNFSLLINLASTCDAQNAEILAEMVIQYAKIAKSALDPKFEALLQGAASYYKDILRESRFYLEPDEAKKEDLRKILAYIKGPNLNADELQTHIYELSKVGPNVDQQKYFKELYQILLGQVSGPRLGTLFALLGKERSKTLLEDILCKT